MADKKQTMLYGLLTSIASKITYDNTTSGLEADNVQDAIDEVNDKANNLYEIQPNTTVQLSLLFANFPNGDRIRVILTNPISSNVTRAEFVSDPGSSDPRPYIRANGTGMFLDNCTFRAIGKNSVDFNTSTSLSSVADSLGLLQNISGIRFLP